MVRIKAAVSCSCILRVRESVQLIWTCMTVQARAVMWTWAVKAEKWAQHSQGNKTRVPIQGSEHDWSYGILFPSTVN